MALPGFQIASLIGLEAVKAQVKIFSFPVLIIFSSEQPYFGSAKWDWMAARAVKGSCMQGQEAGPGRKLLL